MRITAFGDVTAGRILPELSVYADGRVIRPGSRVPGHEEAPLAVRTLTPMSLAVLWSSINDGVTQGFAEPAPPVHHGFVTYVVAVRRSDRLVTAWTTNASTSPEARALVALADRWAPSEGEVPAGGWSDAWAPYLPTSWYLTFERVADEPLSERDASELEPVIGDPAAFGTSCSGRTSGVISAATNAAVAALLGSPLHVLDELNLGGTTVVLETTPLLPEDEPPCPTRYF